MTLHLFNTLSGKVEPLYAADGQALRFYCCGPTVYDYGHIGNFRTFVHVDFLRRAMKLFGLRPLEVMNITDVDDKIIRKAALQQKTIGEFSAKFERAFLEDMAALGMETPEHLPHATDNIPGMVRLIEQLAAKGIAYQTDDGSWYFRIARFPAYGQLSKKDLAGMEDGARIDSDEYDKDSARDFALWKAVKRDDAEATNASWDTPLGPGRPGWHIECSAMAERYLGESFDLHAGGEDLMFPHHENEIAQSESASGKPFARHWFHVRFLLVEGRKMSKSEGNFFTLRDLLLRGYRASAIRFLLLSVPYRHQLNFTFDGLAESTAAVERLRTFQQRLQTCKWPTGAEDDALLGEVAAAMAAFDAALANDLNTAEARAAVFELLRALNTTADQGRLTQTVADAALALLERFDSVFAVLEDHDAELTRAAVAWAQAEGRDDEIAPEVLAQFGSAALHDDAIEALIADRTRAKQQRNFTRADAIRKELLEQGILLEDSKDGVRWKRK